MKYKVEITRSGSLYRVTLWRNGEYAGRRYCRLFPRMEANHMIIQDKKEQARRSYKKEYEVEV